MHKITTRSCLLSVIDILHCSALSFSPGYRKWNLQSEKIFLSRAYEELFILIHSGNDYFDNSESSDYFWVWVLFCSGCVWSYFVQYGKPHSIKQTSIFLFKWLRNNEEVPMNTFNIICTAEKQLTKEAKWVAIISLWYIMTFLSECS